MTFARPSDIKTQGVAKPEPNRDTSATADRSVEWSRHEAFTAGVATTRLRRRRIRASPMSVISSDRKCGQGKALSGSAVAVRVLLSMCGFKAST